MSCRYKGELYNIKKLIDGCDVYFCYLFFCDEKFYIYVVGLYVLCVCIYGIEIVMVV